ncbi:AcrB/AcrD/AcrF family protein [Photobacterium swingsii]|uniref:AcrB/AcrD/AcrF family protein n=1 Tax=Photobacterium swingsii TaxID=680026 RepID=A0A2T3P311_9GAMM|nr:efflux RND transporter permease subunit [Photobacterium swingsii]PSW22851.1 AcrB/AcrD/AcrF family protein [Photobacterium swingsii]
MTNLLRFFAERHFLARIITVMVLAVGLGIMSQIRLQELPDVAFPEVQIDTQYPGASAQDIELNITNKLEKELRSVQGIRKFESTSSNGISSIRLELDESIDLNKAVREIQQAVDRVSDLPKDIPNPPIVLQESTASFEVLRFGVTGGDSYSELREYVRGLEKRIRNIAGVGSVTLSGFREREFWIEVDPNKVRRYQLTVDDVMSAVNNRNLSLSGGIVESWTNEQRLVALTQVHSVSELEQLVVKVLSGGGIVRLSDIATVLDTFEKGTEIATINSQFGILFNVTKSASADIKGTVDAVRQLLDAEAAQLNHQYAYPLSLNVADDMSEKFSIVAVNGGVGLILVLLVLSLLLKRQVAFWVAVSIPVCVFGVIAVLPVVGQDLDSITLAALLLVIGIIVDDSVIVAESIYQEREAGHSAIDAAVQGTAKVMKPIMANLLTTALVFIPMFFLPGTLGMAIAVIPATVLLALSFSFAECTVTLPAHLASSLQKENQQALQQDVKAHFFDRPKAYYQALLQLCLQWKKTVVMVSLLLLTFSMAAVSTMRIDFFPTQAAKYVEVYTEVKPGLPIEAVKMAHAEFEAVLKALPQEELVSYEMTYASPVSTGRINFSAFEDRHRSLDSIVEQLNRDLSDSESLSLVKLTIDAGGPPPGEPVEIRVISNNHDAREQAAAQVMTWLAEYPSRDGKASLINITTNETLKDPQLQIKPQYEWLARYGLTVNDLATTLRVAFDGDQVSSTWLGDEEVDLRVIMAEKYRTADMLANTKIYTATGDQVPLSRLAKVESVMAPRKILHFNGDRQLLVTAQLADENLSPDDIAAELLSAMVDQLPAGVTINTGGEAEQTNETLGGLMVAFPAAMLGVYFVLAILFHSLVQPLLVMAVIPFAFVSALMALKLHFQPISLFAMIGILGMIGVVVNNALVLINRANECVLQGMRPELAVLDAAVSRLRPILLTTLTTVVGLLPLAYGIGGTDVYMGPMSLTLGYGLLLSLPVVLIVIPCLYLVFHRQPRLA